LLKVAGAGAAAVLGVGVVAALSSEDEPPEPPMVAAWVLEGEFYQRREMAAWVLEAPEAADRGTVRWVNIDQSHWRMEVTADDEVEHLTLARGEREVPVGRVRSSHARSLPATADGVPILSAT
jgi:hypothetical protein